ncbi:hypothetical protein FJY63_03920 [Candidatus Sumerlaeota bacterium]|jgi:hypothetical protein|nr:hypothetical protein [Candidatus Sumerlaeota bacterium]
MSRKQTTTPTYAGLPKFGDDDAPELVVRPSKEVRDQAKAAATSIGFGPDRTPEAPSAAERPTARKRERRVAKYPAHYSLRMTDEDRDRFDAYAENHRIPKGEAMRRLLDLADAEERRKQ